MIPEKMLEVLKYEGPAAIVTEGPEGAHVVNSWNSYLKVTDDEKILVPVGGMNKTEANVKQNNKVLMTVGSREVEGLHSKGTGFLITGTASFVKEGSAFEEVKQRFPWARAALEVTPSSVKQTL